jgi:DNA ligase (NAD+)
MTDVQKRIAELTDRIHYLNHRYYQDSVSEVPDKEFDLMLKELQNLETKFPEFAFPNSPTKRLGGSVSKGFKQVKHAFPMLSLGNTYSESELYLFKERVEKGLAGQHFNFVCELKFDGVAISLTYENGILVQALTRGDGVFGDDVTENVKTINSIPIRLQEGNWPKKFEVRGEIFIAKDVFKEINSEREDIGEEPLANPRNAASGTLKMLDSRIVAQRRLDCFVYHLITEDDIIDTHSQSIIYLKSWGFPVSNTWKKCEKISEVFEYINEWEGDAKNKFNVATDGIVIKVDSIAQQKELGFTAKTPKWATSFKYKPESATTVLESISYQVGRTGAVTPVANLKPVQLAGTKVKRASLHNADEIARLDLRIGDSVFVEKGGEIIPKITGVNRKIISLFTQPITFPTHCPACETALVRTEGEAAWYCPNEMGCPPQRKGRMEHFIQRKALNIDGLGAETIDLLFEKKLIADSADLYKLTYEQLIGLDRFADKSARNLLAGIEKSKSVPFPKVLFGIGIRFVGATVAEKLAEHFGSMDNIAKATHEELIQAPEIGEKIALSVLAFFQDPASVQFVEKLKSAGVQLAMPEGKEAESDALAGLSFVISGVFSTFSREELQDKIKANGGKLISSVSAKVNYLVAGENMGPAKLEKATKLGVKILTETEFIEMLPH